VVHRFNTFRDIGFSDFIHRPSIKKQTKENHDVSETGSVSVLRFFPSPEDGNRSSFRNVVVFLSLFFNTRTMDKSENPISLKVIHHCQNPILTTGSIHTRMNI
jgi:hypothetical protein